MDGCSSILGECWSGKESEMNYNRDGKSERCWAEDFKSCPYNSYNCVGRDYANRVYRLRTGKVFQMVMKYTITKSFMHNNSLTITDGGI